MKVTMREIARATNVSVTTVSNVLQGRGRVGDKTRTLVLAKAEEMGYFRQSRPTATGLLGLIFCTPPRPHTGSEPQSSLPEVASYYTSQAVEGIEQIARQNGFQLLFQIFRGGESDGALPEMVEQRTVEGLFLIGGSIADDYILSVYNRGIPLVLLFTHVERADINAVLADNSRGAFDATSHLLRLGHQRIGFINGWDATRTSAAKMAGFRQAHAEAGLPITESLCVQGNFTFESGYRHAQRMLATAAPPTALFVADDVMALGAMRAARELGLRIPGDLAVVGFGDGPLSAQRDPPLTTVSVPKRHIGELAIRRLLEMLHDDGRGGPAQRIVVATHLIVRESCGASQLPT